MIQFIEIKFKNVTSKRIILPDNSNKHKSIILNPAHIVGVIVGSEDTCAITCIGNIRYELNAEGTAQLLKKLRKGKQ